MVRNNPSVSIIVPTYNVENYARFCFDSLIKQSLKNIEIILVDDGSTDSSGRICEEYALKDSRIKVIHQTNRGLGLSRNSGMAVATGEYIGFVDSDDCISKEMFKILYDNIRSHGADICYCTYKKFTVDNELMDDKEEAYAVKVWKGEKEIRQYMLDRIGLSPQYKKDNLYGASVCCGLFSRNLLLKQEARFISERQFIAEDMLFDIDVIPHCEKIVHCDIPLYYYRYNPNSLTTVYKPDRFEKNVQLYYEMYRKLGKIFRLEECFNSMSRYLLVTARIAVMQEARFVKKNGWKMACGNVYRICDNEELQKILMKYEYKKLPIKYRVICGLQKRKSTLLLILLCQLQKRL